MADWLWPAQRWVSNGKVVAVRRWWSVLVSGLVAWCLVVSLSLADKAFAAPGDPVPAAKQGTLPVGPDGLVGLDATVTRPDWTSATVSSRILGKPVEVLSERSESRRPWVWPDGRVQVEQAGAAVRFRDPSATRTQGWSAVDRRARACQFVCVSGVVTGRG